MTAPSRRTVLSALAGGAAVAAGVVWLPLARQDRPPNVVLLLTDDQGFNDLGCYYTPPAQGAREPIATPSLDALAASGVRLTSFYVASSVCTTSRAALLTGCYPPRVGFGHKEAGTGVLTPDSVVGLAPAETTVAEVLRGAGYRTGCFGKWHLGHLPPFVPTAQGFDEYFGIPWSPNQRPLPLVRGTEVLRRLEMGEPVDAEVAREAIGFVQRHRRRPFLLYVAFSATHEPLAVLPEYAGASGRGRYADALVQTDTLIGTIVDALDRAGLRERTLIVFASDNGPEVGPAMRAHAWPFRGGKGDLWEGGYRSPSLWSWPGVLPESRTVDALVTAMDVLPTCARLADVPLPDATIDGHDALPVLTGQTGSAYDAFAYFGRGRLEAVRGARFKRVYDNPIRRPPVAAALYDLDADPGEEVDVAAVHPDEVTALDAFAERMRDELGDALHDRTGRAVRPLGRASERT